MPKKSRIAAAGGHRRQRRRIHTKGWCIMNEKVLQFLRELPLTDEVKNG